MQPKVVEPVEVIEDEELVAMEPCPNPECYSGMIGVSLPQGYWEYENCPECFGSGEVEVDR